MVQRHADINILFAKSFCKYGVSDLVPTFAMDGEHGKTTNEFVIYYKFFYIFK